MQDGFRLANQLDVICQAKSGMGKTAVFVISTLQQLEPVDGEVSVVVLCHTRELAYQICHEYERFTTYMKVGPPAAVESCVPVDLPVCGCLVRRAALRFASWMQPARTRW